MPTLRVLLDDVREGRVEDRDGELLGTLLSALYPDHVGPEEVWDYLLPLRSSVVGTHYLFWSHRLRENTSGSDTIRLIQALLAKGKRIPTVLLGPLACGQGPGSPGQGAGRQR